ncbi:O-acyltransferase like protein-like [Pieris napi]|uniref:O-acyltransferase like protein-like n=1 Tax=Pieris napi TaxID=78633 RepID=UPI001FBA7AF3|nr:O-acyltransferase like protein-like [Pieris napi]XP_047525120.1 O-acyltransferase like protein-like [Pieris napi]
MDTCFAFLLLASAACGTSLKDEYYSMPPLFQLDDYDTCLVKNGIFCLGSFQLTIPKDNGVTSIDSQENFGYSYMDYRGKKLYDILQANSNEKHRFNHTLIHRGLCSILTCFGRADGHLSNRKQFQQCVNDITRSQYGLDATLIRLDYCKSAQTPRRVPPDVADQGFFALCAALLVANLLGTFYDLFRNKDKKDNQLLLSWSIINNFKKLIHVYPNEDTLVSRFNPIHGIKSVTLIVVIFAHSVIVSHISYLHNPDFLETRRQHPLAMILTNGSIAVQGYILLSSFLFIHNFQLMESRHKISSIQLFFIMLLRRIFRILPVYMFMVYCTATWSRFLGDGPLWIPIMDKEAQLCRLKWWSHALFIHNLYRPNDRCLLQTWFIAVDMQLYALAILLAIVLTQRRRAAVKTLLVMFVVAVLCIFVAAYTYDLTAMVFITTPEYVRKLYHGEPSFNWLYAAPWGSLPASLLGVMLGFLYYNLREDKINLQNYRWFRVLYRISIVGIFAWMLSAYLLPQKPSYLFSKVYAAIDRPVYAIFFSVMLLGSIYRIDQLWWRFASWSGWQVFGRMSLCIFMIHWSFDLLQIGLQTNTNKMSFFEIGGHWFVTIFMTCITSIPLHIMVEKPIQMFLRASLNI